MKTTFLSPEFQRLYCSPTILESFSRLHPISFRRVLPFQSADEAIDQRNLLAAEEAYLANQNDTSRRQVIEEYQRCRLLPEAEAANLLATLDYHDVDFFETMGLAYANAGKYRCALRWYREFITRLESENASLRSDEESVYASVGYSLYALNLFAETIAWSRSCIGPRQMADTICQALIYYETQPDGQLQAVQHARSRTRYVINAPTPANVGDTVTRLKDAMRVLVPFQEIYIEWVNGKSPGNPPPGEGYPFGDESDSGNLVRHRMNLIFALCGEADSLIERHYHQEATRLLIEAALLEPNADFVHERLEAIRMRT